MAAPGEDTRGIHPPTTEEPPVKSSIQVGHQGKSRLSQLYEEEKLQRYSIPQMKIESSNMVEPSARSTIAQRIGREVPLSDDSTGRVHPQLTEPPANVSKPVGWQQGKSRWSQRSGSEKLHFTQSPVRNNGSMDDTQRTLGKILMSLQDDDDTGKTPRPSLEPRVDASSMMVDGRDEGMHYSDSKIRRETIVPTLEEKLPSVEEECSRSHVMTEGERPESINKESVSLETSLKRDDIDYRDIVPSQQDSHPTEKPDIALRSVRVRSPSCFDSWNALRVSHLGKFPRSSVEETLRTEEVQQVERLSSVVRNNLKKDGYGPTAGLTPSGKDDNPPTGQPVVGDRTEVLAVRPCPRTHHIHSSSCEGLDRAARTTMGGSLWRHPQAKRRPSSRSSQGLWRAIKVKRSRFYIARSACASNDRKNCSLLLPQGGGRGFQNNAVADSPVEAVPRSQIGAYARDQVPYYAEGSPQTGGKYSLEHSLSEKSTGARLALTKTEKHRCSSKDDELGPSILQKHEGASQMKSRINEVDPLTLERLPLRRRNVEPPEDGYGPPPEDGNVGSEARDLGVLHARSDTPVPEFGPDLVGGVVTVDHSSFTTQIEVHGGKTAHRAHLCVALLDSGSPSTFVARSKLDAMLADGSVTADFVRTGPRRRWSGFTDSKSALQTSHLVRLSVQFFRNQQPTAQLAVWAHVVPDKVLQQDVLLGRDSFMRFDHHDYTVIPQIANQRVTGELTLRTRCSARGRGICTSRSYEG